MLESVPSVCYQTCNWYCLTRLMAANLLLPRKIENRPTNEHIHAARN